MVVKESISLSVLHELSLFVWLVITCSARDASVTSHSGRVLVA